MRKRMKEAEGGAVGSNDEMEASESENENENGTSEREEEDFTSELDEPTMNERLEDLGMTDVAIENEKELSRELIDSKAAVVLQGLMSTDDNLLSSIICTKHGDSVVRSTVSKLPADVATGVLLKAISSKLRSDPKHSANLIPWLREIVFQHNIPHRNETVEKIIEYGALRLENLSALTRLQGRLELVARRTDQARKLKESSVGLEADLEYSMR